MDEFGLARINSESTGVPWEKTLDLLEEAKMAMTIVESPKEEDKKGTGKGVRVVDGEAKNRGSKKRCKTRQSVRVKKQTLCWWKEAEGQLGWVVEAHNDETNPLVRKRCRDST